MDSTSWNSSSSYSGQDSRLFCLLEEAEGWRDVGRDVSRLEPTREAWEGGWETHACRFISCLSLFKSLGWEMLVGKVGGGLTGFS